MYTDQNSSLARHLRHIQFAVVTLFVALCLPLTAYAGVVGTVVFAKGVISAEGEAGARLLAKGDDIFEGDLVTTANESFVVIRFDDESKLTLRPQSEFRINRHNSKEGEEEADYSLLKGGLRTITGLLGKRKPEAVRYNTPEASIGIRGTDLLMRLCGENDCREEEALLIKAEPMATACPYEMETVKAGLFYAVLDGGISATSNFDNSTIELDAIAAGFAHEKEFTCLSTVKGFLLYDPYLKSIEFDDLSLELYELFGKEAAEYDMCLVPGG